MRLLVGRTGGGEKGLIVRVPRIKSGVFCNEPVISYDLTATVLDFVAPVFILPKGIEGGSWKSVLLNSGTGKVKRPIDRFVWLQATEVEHPHSAIRKGDFKLIHFWATRSVELSDLTHDLSEAHNLASKKPDQAAQLQKELKDDIRAGLGEQAFGALERGEVPQDRGGKGGPKRPRK